MAGTNVVLKKGEKLFQEGDPSDGMYLVRKGEVMVYLEKGGKQVKLALLKEGAMIGEMSLFDQKPRSASAQATADSEITKISTEDFVKLMKQIPKWFVSLMASLSTRLRETNERLQNLENKVAGASNPVHQLIRVLEALDLIFQKAIKEAKLWEIEEEVVTTTLNKLLDEKPEYTAQLVSALTASKMFEVRKNTYKKNILGTQNRGQFRKFIEFFGEILKANPTYKPIPVEACAVFDCLEKMASQSAYDSVTIPFEELCEEAARTQQKTDNWKESLEFYKIPLGGVQLTKTSTGIGFKVDKKTVGQLRPQIELIRALKKISVL